MVKALLINHSLSLLIALALLIAGAACVRQLKYSVADKLEAFVSIFFGVATSSLLLSLMWLVRRKTLNRPWPTQGSYFNEVASMNPRGREGSLDSLDNAITIISSSELDRPPNYEDALAHSKPISHYMKEEKNACSRRASNCKCLSTRNHDQNSLLKICPTCLKQLPSSSVSQLASIVVRGFQPLDEECAMHIAQSYKGTGLREKCEQNQRTRQTSYVLVDAHQLMASNTTALPNYSELFIDDPIEINRLSKQH